MCRYVYLSFESESQALAAYHDGIVGVGRTRTHTINGQYFGIKHKGETGASNSEEEDIHVVRFGYYTKYALKFSFGFIFVDFVDHDCL